MIADIYGEYCQWAEQNHEKTVNNKLFKQLMEAKSFVYKETKAGNFVLGVGLREKES